MIDFPASPVGGQFFAAAGVTWQFDGVKWVAYSAQNAGYLPLTGGALSGPLVVTGDIESSGPTAAFSLHDRGIPGQVWNTYATFGAYRIALGGSIPSCVIDNLGNMALTGAINCVGRNARAGVNGIPASYLHNINWTTGAQLWIDDTNVGTITVTCDYRLKENVVDLPSTWDNVKAMRPVSYTFKEQPDPTPVVAEADSTVRWGFLAHELQDALLPSAASGVKDEPNLIQSPDLLALIASLTRALQEAMQRIELLEQPPAP